jgi:hypothetical protein
LRIKIITMRKYFWLIIALPLLSSCRHFWGKRVRGNGNIKTEERTVSSFKNLDVSSSFNVHLTQGDLKPIKIEGDENLLQYIEVTQEGDKIIIKNRKGFNLEGSNDLNIYVSAPVFNSISLSGAGNIEAENKITGSENLELDLSGAGDIKMEIEVPGFKADISGAGSMFIKGQTKDVDIGVSGVGSAHCYELMAENTKVDVSGVGSAEVYASVKLDAQVNGVGSVNYKGNATNVSQHVSGVGSINKE